ncbi:hypothetical protein Kisp01_64240 [Kineosporia sp. NBRC 101677]|uniref:hypothetical protein n=1 Tax=Kineosporia sp. NBRC 101677 TaxID=3032197 RepID=UPI00249FC9C3|nr:hypothetical protein [Kineosporia sp. NBRC 101677]GLY19410.1 hypothetical protein Kisp01_64240 [Kineosporia sp. NBRC 101677]
MDEQVAALMRANLHEVFGQRDPQARDDAAGRTYTDDVVFADEDGAVTGRKALVARASGLLGSVPADFAFTEDGPVYEGTGTAALA